MVDYKNNKINNIPELKIGDGKEPLKIRPDIKLEGLKDWFIGLIIRF